MPLAPDEDIDAELLLNIRGSKKRVLQNLQAVKKDLTTINADLGKLISALS